MVPRAGIEPATRGFSVVEPTEATTAHNTQLLENRQLAALAALIVLLRTMLNGLIAEVPCTLRCTPGRDLRLGLDRSPRADSAGPFREGLSPSLF